MNTATISLEYLDELRDFVEKSKSKNNAQIVIGFEGWKREWYTEKEVKERIIKDVESHFEWYIEQQKNLPKGILERIKMKAKNIFK